MRTGWRAALVVVAVVAAACGNSTVGNGDGSGGWRAKLPVGSGGGGGAGDASGATMKAEVGTDAVSSGAPAPMIAPYQPIEYRLAADAKAPARTAEAYQLKPAKDGVAARVAKALGVEADRVEAESGFGDWYYSSDDPNAAVSSSGVAVACAPDAKCVAPEPTTVPPLEGVPSADDATAKARSIFAALGQDVGEDDLSVEGEDGRFRTVTYEPSVGGVPVPMLQSAITFGAHGQVQYARGFLFHVESLGRYPLVSLADAFDRYQHGFGGQVGVADAARPVMVPAEGQGESGSGSGTATASAGDAGCAADGPDCSGAASTGGGTAPAGCAADKESCGAGGASTSGSAGCAADGPDCGVAQPGAAVAPSEPAPGGGPSVTVEPQPTPDPSPPATLEPRIVEVTGARLVLEPVATGCLDDPVYLVPAFELSVGEAPQSIGTVTAVADEALDTRSTAGAEARRPCPEDQVEETPAGKPEPAPVPPPHDAGTVEPQPAPAPDSAPPRP